MSDSGETLPLASFDFVLPSELIAQQPAVPRDASRLLVLDRHTGATSHHRFHQLADLLRPGDLLVVNRTKVIPARLRARKPTGGAVEVMACRPVDGTHSSATRWEVLARPADALAAGKRVVLASGLELVGIGRRGMHVVVEASRPLGPELERAGEVPLPPYIERERGPRGSDDSDYQTLFAREPGAIAAPTASLHFTPEVLASLRGRGVDLAEVLLHVGAGTFLPIREENADDIRQHVMHEEQYEVPDESIRALEATRRAGGRIVAVGTTTVRALESWGSTGASRGATDLFITPGFAFRWVDALVTNFHLPRSTLLVLVSAFAGRERVLAAYREAIDERYRFFSYGDAMLIA